MDMLTLFVFMEESFLAARRTEISWLDVLSGNAEVMIESFSEATDYEDKDFKPSLYAILNEERTPIYIGKSTRIYGRLLDHLGIGPFSKQPSAIGQHIIDNQPQSQGWIVIVIDCPLLLESTAINLMRPIFNVDRSL